MSNIETNLYIRGFDKTQDAFKSLHKSLKTTATKVEAVEKKMKTVTAVSKKMAVVGGVAFGALALGIRSVVTEALDAERVTVTFDAMTKSIGTDTVNAIEGMRKATRGLVNDTELMKAGNKFMAMGLATNQDEMEKLSEIATKLGSAMGNDATSSMENFALMLANQSILRLDSFGISSGKVRERIAELTTGTNALTREQAFMQATMESAEASMAKLGDTALTNGEKMQAFRARMDNLKQTLGDALIPILQQVLDKIQPIIDRFIAWTEANPELAGKILVVSAGIAGLVAVLGILGTMLMPIVIAFTIMSSPIILVVAGITALVGILAFAILKWETFRNIVTGIWSSLPNFVQTGIQVMLAPMYILIRTIDFIVQNFDALVAGMKTGVNLMIGMAEAYANVWVKAVNTIIKALNKIQVSIPDWVPKIGGNSFGVNLPLAEEVSIPRLAKGGIATKSILANVGEAGPEAIIPLNKLNSFGVGGQPIVVHIDTFVGEEQFAETIGDKLAMVLQRNQQIQA